ncbi:hypothetical protein GGC64_006211 [Mycobacterium sp. OAS707]|uniref:outer membrane protein assembly factor BamB family protein n=1 Tax=Mycobacterium sp. OAS707 TaxID=2663822 RepID=UPI00178A514B|nr:PQQ-binding-like beta-propeller repeat protein [Mycobacterium sp. OAS707]MBE1552124.1 hypothetical protein [Mycobacterium sp. OAS707]
MRPETHAPVGDRAQQLRGSRIRNGCLGFGVTALLGAIAVGVYGLSSSQAHCLDRCAARTSFAAWGWAAVSASVVLVTAAAVVVARGRDRGPRESGIDAVAWLSTMYVISAAVAVVALAPWAVLHDALTLGPPSMQGPAVAGAVVLSVLGALALGLGRRALLESRKAMRRSRVGGSVLALVVILALSATGLHAGDDGRFVQADTADPAAVSPTPAQFGQQRFHIKIGDLSGADVSALDQTQFQFFVAGAGFVVFDGVGGELVAYDSAGRQRWHYRRTGPDAVRVRAVHAYDGGATLVALLYNGNAGPDAPETFVGFDAVTGRQLWSGSGELLELAFGNVAHPGPYFVARQKDSWTLVDARTGRQVWRMPNPQTCGDNSGDIYAVGGLLVEAYGCQDHEDVVDTLLTVEAATGKVVRQQQLRRIDAASGPVDIIDISRGGRDGILCMVKWVDGRRSTLYANAVTGQIVDLGDRLARSDTVGDGNFFALSFTTHMWDMLGTNAVVHCTLPPSEGQSIDEWMDVGIAWYPNQFAYVAPGGRLVIADRDSCQTLTTVPLSGDPFALRVAGGVTLLVSGEGADLYVTGYAPNSPAA